MVSQDVQLFHATLRDNLTLFAESVDDQHLLDVLYRLGPGDWAMSLPSGLDTVLPPGGVVCRPARVSARLRPCLPPIPLVPSEASSRLDPATERLEDAPSTSFFAGRTGIIIAHRLATLERADEIPPLPPGWSTVSVRFSPDPSSHFAHYLRVGLEEVLV